MENLSRVRQYHIQKQKSESFWRKRLLIVGVTLLCLLPSILLAEKKVTDPYFDTVISQVMVAYEDGKLVPVKRGETVISDPYELGHIAYPAILLAIAKVCGVAPKYVQFLPIGGLLVPLLYFVLLRKLARSDLIASLFAIYIAYEPMLSEGHFNSFAYAWARPLFFTFFILCVRILSQRTQKDILLLVIVYIGTFLIYWTTPLWMFSLWACLSLIQILQAWLTRHAPGPKQKSISLVLVLGIIYLAFSRLLYRYIPAVADAVYGDPVEGWTLFIWQIKNLLLNSPETGPYEYVGATSTNPLLGWTLLIRYIVLLTPVIIYILLQAKNILKTRSLIPNNQNQSSLLIWGGLAVVIGHTSIYALRGHISFRPVLLVFPIIGFICLEQIRLPKAMRLVFPLALSILAICGFVLHYSETQSYDVESSAQWFLDHAEGTKILTDLYTSQEYLLEQIDHERWLEMSVYDADAYQFVVGGTSAQDALQPSKNEWDYIIIDNGRLQQPVLSGGWRLYEPLSEHSQEIHANRNVNVIYDEGLFWILQTDPSSQ